MATAISGRACKVLLIGLFVNIMFRLLFLLLMVVLPGVIITGVIYVILKALSGIAFNPESAAWKKLVQELRNRIQALNITLTPWDNEMLSLLSLNQTANRKPGWLRSHSEGVFLSIYQEPLLAYAVQQAGKDRVTIARTQQFEAILRHKGRETEVWIDGQPFGLWIENSLIEAGKSSRLLAQIERSPDQALWPVTLGNTTAAALQNPERADGPNPRALSLLRNLTPAEERTLIVVFLLNIELGSAK